MKPLLVGICIALAATVAQGQPFDVSITPMSSRAVIDFKDQFNHSATKGCVGVAFQITPTAMQPPANSTGLVPLRLRYAYTPPTGGETILTSPPRLIVNDVDFSSSTQPSAVNTGAGNTKEEQVQIEWKLKPSHLIEVELGQLGIIRPLVCIDSEGAVVAATTEKQGKLQTATEEFSRTFVGFGARARSFASKGLWVDAGLALGSGYEKAEVSANVHLTNGIHVAGGYRHRVKRFEQGTTVRRGDVFGEVGVRF